MLKSIEIFPNPASKLEPINITPKSSTSKSHANLPKPSLSKAYNATSLNKMKINPFSVSPKHTNSSNKIKQSFDLQYADKSEFK